MLQWLYVFLSLCVLSACTADTEHFVLGVSTEEPGPGIAAAAKQLLVDARFSVEIRSIESSAHIISGMLDGDIDFGIIEEPAALIPDLATVVPLYPSILHVLYKGEETVNRFTDVIVGKRIYAGPPDGTASRFFAQLGDYFEIDAGSYTVLDNPWVVSPDVYFVFGGLLDANSRRRLGDYRLFSFGDAAQLGKGTLVEGIALQFPNVEAFVLPEQIYGSLNPNTVLTITTRTVLVTAASTDVQHVYNVASTLFANSQRLSTEYSLVTREMNENIQLSSFTLPMHAGARRYLDKDAPTMIERYADVIALGLTIAIMLGSALVALYEFRKTRKKDRIDDYYNRILELRHKLREAVTEEHRSGIEEQVKSIQEEVFSLLVAERLSANESLTIFLNLSNQVLSEAQDNRTAAR